MGLFAKTFNLLLEKDQTSWKETSWKDGDLKVSIEDVIKYLDNNQIPIKNVDIDKIKEVIIDQDYKKEHKKRVEKSNFKYPIIVVVRKGKYKSILDGNHRAYKALKEGLKKIKVRELNLDSKNTPKEFKQLFDYEIEKLQEQTWNGGYMNMFMPMGKKKKGMRHRRSIVLDPFKRKHARTVAAMHTPDMTLIQQVERLKNNPTVNVPLNIVQLRQICKKYGIHSVSKLEPKKLGNTGIMIVWNDKTNGFMLKK